MGRRKAQKAQEEMRVEGGLLGEEKHCGAFVPNARPMDSPQYQGQATLSMLLPHPHRRLRR